jgi:AcrR family transcriptional regulator
MVAAVAVGSVRRDRAAEITRRRILKVVEHLLAHGGEDAVSIRDICLRAAVTPPTIYHHFGDKQALIDRVISDCFVEFDRTMARRRVPADPVEVLRVGFDRYVEYGVAHPSHYRLMFQLAHARPTAAGMASFNKLRSAIAAVDAVGRLRAPVDEAAFAYWSAVHGITSLLAAGFGHAGDAAVALVRDALIERLTKKQLSRHDAKKKKRQQGGQHESRE